MNVGVDCPESSWWSILAAAAEPQHSSRRIAHVGMPLSKRDLLLSGGQNDKVTILIAVGLGALRARGAILF